MRKLVLLTSFLTLTACSTVTDVFTKPSPSFLSYKEGEEQLLAAEACCSDGNIFDKDMVSVTSALDQKYFIDADNTRAFNFPTGKSFFKVFQLPLNVAYLQIEMEATIITTVFQPRVDFYNKDRKLVSTLRPSAFRYRDSFMGDGSLSAKMAINNAGAAPGHEFAYMVIYTTDEARADTTSIMNPETKRQEARNLQKTELPNIQIKHSAIGEINVTFRFRQKEDDVTNDIISYFDGPLFGGEGKSNREENVILANGKAISTSSQSIGSTAVVSLDGSGNEVVNASSGVSNMQNQAMGGNAPAGSMLKETEELYNKLIRNSVQNGDLSRAMSLVGEAQRAGSATAQQTFVDAIQSMKK